MMKDFKLAVSMLKYSFQFKMQIALMLIFVVVGVVIELLSKGGYWLGIFFMLIGPMYFSQMLYGLCMSNMVQSSPYKKRLQTTLPALGNLIFSAITMAIIMVMKFVEMKTWPESVGSNLNSMAMAAIFMFIFNVYTAIVFKYYYIALICMLVPVWGMSFWGGYHAAAGEISALPAFSNGLGFGALVAVGFAAVILGSLIQYLVSLAIYKKQLSKNAQGAMLKRYMK